jgi:hypothetical protein
MRIHPCEKLGLRLFWLARLFGSREGDVGPAIDGSGWQSLVFEAIRSVGRGLIVQGPMNDRLFGRYGGSGMAAEVDAAIDDTQRCITLVEAKAAADYRLGRDKVLVFAGKVRDHERSAHWRGQRAYALVASAGRLTSVFCRWCFYEGIDVLDPDRLPLGVLVRLPALLRQGFEALPRPHLHDWLIEALLAEQGELRAGPVQFRREERRARLVGDLLRDLNVIQSALTEDILDALATSESDCAPAANQSALMERAERELRQCGIAVPTRCATSAGRDARVMRRPLSNPEASSPGVYRLAPQLLQVLNEAGRLTSFGTLRAGE